MIKCKNTFYAYWGPIRLNLLFSLQGVRMYAPSWIVFVFKHERSMDSFRSWFVSKILVHPPPTTPTQTHTPTTVYTWYFTYCQCWGGWWQILWMGCFWKHLSHAPTFNYIQLLCLQKFCSVLFVSPYVVCLLIWIPENGHIKDCLVTLHHFWFRPSLIYEDCWIALAWSKNFFVRKDWWPWSEQNGDVLFLVLLLPSKFSLLPQLGRPCSYS